GAVFEGVISTSSWTLPAHASMLTGRLPASHRLQDDGTRLPDGVPTLAEGLTAAGYRTMAVVSHVYVSSVFGLDRGFDHFDESLTHGGTTNPRAAEVVDRALAWIGEDRSQPWFLFVHLFDPHTDYDPPPPFRARFTDAGYRGPVDGTLDSLKPLMNPASPADPADLKQAVALYDGEIAYTDDQIGRLLDRLDTQGLRQGAVIIITSDHGEEFR
ncbi:MAG: sulfatase-like hydrolase/transferase, partial [bacterium]|nr:sulfatase-like hydrolase/transferase [bacterium]